MSFLSNRSLPRVQSISEGYHEELADDLLLSFSGTQTMVADHHGVMIENAAGVARAI